MGQVSGLVEGNVKMNRELPGLAFHLVQCVKECDDLEEILRKEKKLNEELLRYLNFIEEWLERGYPALALLAAKEAIEWEKNSRPPPLS
jgi:hypothetical protein